MSNDKQQPQPARPIPVRRLDFDRTRMLPSGSMSSVIESTFEPANRARFTIEYIRIDAVFRVAYYEPSQTVPKKIMMYPREWASWEPVPQ